MIQSENSKAVLMMKLKHIREQIPCSLEDQADAIGVSVAAIHKWNLDKECKIPLRHETVRQIKDYIKRYEATK